MKKEYRLRKNQDFQRIIGKRKRYFNADLTVHIDQKEGEQARIGLSVSKKVGNAVIRNKIKRQLRMMLLEVVEFESFPYDMVIIVRKTFLEHSYQTNKNNLENLLKRYIKCSRI